MKHLLREYEDQKGVGACGRKGLKDREVTTKACEVTCPRCHGTKAFAKAAKHPFYGLKGKRPKQARKQKKSKRNEKPAVVAERKLKERRRDFDLWDDVLLGK